MLREHRQNASRNAQKQQNHTEPGPRHSPRKTGEKTRREHLEQCGEDEEELLHVHEFYRFWIGSELHKWLLKPDDIMEHKTGQRGRVCEIEMYASSE